VGSGAGPDVWGAGQDGEGVSATVRFWHAWCDECHYTVADREVCAWFGSLVPREDGQLDWVLQCPRNRGGPVSLLWCDLWLCPASRFAVRLAGRAERCPVWGLWA